MIFTPITFSKRPHKPLPPHFPGSISKRYYAILLPLTHPSINPRFHLSPASSTAYVNRRDNLLNSQRTAEYRELPEAAMFRVWYSKA